MQRKASARGIIFHDNRLLCLRLANFKNLGPADFWCTPGGGVNDAEGIEKALFREMIEETGVTPKIGKLLYVQQRKDNKDENLEFFFYIENTLDYLNIDLSKTTHGKTEVAEISFINPQSENVLPEFLTKTDIANDIASGSAVQFFNYIP